MNQEQRRPGDDLWTRQAELESAAAEIRRIGQSDAGFADVGIDARRSAVVVYTVAPGGPVTEAYSASAPEWADLTFARAVLSDRQRAALDTFIKHKLPELELAGVRLAWWGLREPGGPMLMHVDGDELPGAAVLAAFELFGAGTVAFELGGLAF